jgi:predicted transcriptional regulator
VDASKCDRLSEVLKTKAGEKTVLKIAAAVDELKQISASDMKTLSTMNTTLQVSF